MRSRSDLRCGLSNEKGEIVRGVDVLINRPISSLYRIGIRYTAAHSSGFCSICEEGHRNVNNSE